ncbi:transposase family protein [Leptolyngbya sp. PCC 7375]|nr:transposase family protein [Leptolyngbya sp. PCC 7375]EKU98234.1 transposase family protein [Leptolyngbya sp. PCC 7375]EKU98808.1 transposase family protein [Leptolyngbya sp. PCC 7375]EKV00329.1 transposase family protein [Leptolyngbya sp. PCC 7375]EKV02555.1 transposase family protein [Leptolyngbya sp. PCC 7375]
MILGEVFDRFISESPLSVMLRVLLEQSLPTDEVDALFEQEAQYQYERTLLFSTVVRLMSLVVCGISPSINAAYQSQAKGIGVRVQSVYNKLNGLEPQIIEALVRHGVGKAQALIEHLGGALAPLLPGYRIKIIDGNHLAATDRRLDVLRSQGSAPLPGHALVILDPRLQLAIDVFSCEDGHAQERALLGRVLATVVSGDVWMADRNFCTLGFIGGLHSRAAFFVLRQHGNLPWSVLSPLEIKGESQTGFVFEQTIQVVINETIQIPLRRIVVRLTQSTRDGDTELAIISNLPQSDASAIEIAGLYQRRWRIERLFQVLDQCFRGEIDTLAYPRAALFGFCMALICYNVLAVIKAAMRSVHGAGKIEAGISYYYLADEIRRVYDGMMIAIPPAQWKPLARLDETQTTELFQQLATKMDLSKFCSHPRGKKKKVSKPKPSKNKPHVSTARLLAQKRQSKKAP